jgi:hypothetical protein
MGLTASAPKRGYSEENDGRQAEAQQEHAALVRALMEGARQAGSQEREHPGGKEGDLSEDHGQQLRRTQRTPGRSASALKLE